MRVGSSDGDTLFWFAAAMEKMEICSVAAMEDGERCRSRCCSCGGCGMKMTHAPMVVFAAGSLQVA